MLMAKKKTGMENSYHASTDIDHYMNYTFHKSESSQQISHHTNKVGTEKIEVTTINSESRFKSRTYTSAFNH